MVYRGLEANVLFDWNFIELLHFGCKFHKKNIRYHFGNGFSNTTGNFVTAENNICQIHGGWTGIFPNYNDLCMQITYMFDEAISFHLIQS